MKRVYTFFLSFILGLVCLVTPAFAANFDGGVSKSDLCYNLLDFSTMNDSGTNYIGSPVGGISFTYKNPFPCDIAYVDMLLNFSGGANPGSIHVGRSKTHTQYSLTFENVSGNLWRAYGYINDYYESMLITLGNTKLSYVTVYSIRVFPVYNLNSVDFDASLNVYSESGSVNYTTTNGAVSFYLGANGHSISKDSPYGIRINIDDWKNFDIIDCIVFINGRNITSVSCYLADGTMVPFSCNQLTSPTSDVDYTGNVLQFSCDFSNINKVLASGDLIIDIQGVYDSMSASLAYVDNLKGYVKISSPSPLLSFWYNLKDLLIDIMGSDEDHKDSADEFDSVTNEQVDELGQISTVIGSVEAPDLSAVDMSVNAMVNPNVIAVSTSGLSSALSSQIILKIIIMAMTLGIAGFILYGKK